MKPLKLRYLEAINVYSKDFLDIVDEIGGRLAQASNFCGESIIIKAASSTWTTRSSLFVNPCRLDLMKCPMSIPLVNQVHPDLTQWIRQIPNRQTIKVAMSAYYAGVVSYLQKKKWRRVSLTQCDLNVFARAFALESHSLTQDPTHSLGTKY